MFSVHQLSVLRGVTEQVLVLFPAGRASVMPWSTVSCLSAALLVACWVCVCVSGSSSLHPEIKVYAGYTLHFKGWRRAVVYSTSSSCLLYIHVYNCQHLIHLYCCCYNQMAVWELLAYLLFLLSFCAVLVPDSSLSWFPPVLLYH